MENNQQDRANEYYIDKPYVIVCEGKDDKGFLESYLDYLSENHTIRKENYNILEVNGLDNMKKEMRNYKRYSNYEYMESFLFICDADKNANAAMASMEDHIQRAWNVVLNRHGEFQQAADGVKVGVYIMPGLDDSGNLRNGTLEDLCLDLLETGKEYKNPLKLTKNIDTYISEVQGIRINPLKWPHKNRLHIALSSMNKCVGAKIGEAARQGVFDFSNGKLSRLKEMILQMQNKNTREE